MPGPAQASRLAAACHRDPASESAVPGPGPGRPGRLPVPLAADGRRCQRPVVRVQSKSRSSTCATGSHRPGPAGTGSRDPPLTRRLRDTPSPTARAWQPPPRQPLLVTSAGPGLVRLGPPAGASLTPGCLPRASECTPNAGVPG